LRFKNVLEAGSGTGRISLGLATKGNFCTLADFSKSAIHLSVKISKKLRVYALFIVCDIINMPFEEEVFDLVWNAGALEHYKERSRFLVLTEMLRVGRNVITCNPPITKHFF